MVDDKVSVWDAISTRRSVRAFSDEPIEDGVLNKCLEAARLAPSWANKQCWHFVVVTGKQAVGELGIIPAHIKSAPAVIVACGVPDKSGHWEGKTYYLVDVAIAVEHLVLQATPWRPSCTASPSTSAPETLEGKEELVRRPFQNSTGFVDSTGICLLTKFAITHREIVAMMAPATGLDFTFDKSITQGDRIWNLERLFNLREGFGRAHDTLPPRLLSEPVPEGPSKGWVSRLEPMLAEYYRARGWDENGVPTARNTIPAVFVASVPAPTVESENP